MCGRGVRFRRLQLLNEKGVPTATEIREQLGSPLAEIFFDTLDEQCKRKVGLLPKPKTSPDLLWMSPSDILVGKVALTVPFTRKYIRALTHKGILEIGKRIEDKVWEAWNEETNRKLSELASMLNKFNDIQILRVMEYAERRARERYDQQKVQLVKKFLGAVKAKCFEVRKREHLGRLREIQREREEVQELLEDQKEQAVLTTTYQMALQHEAELLSRLTAQKFEFDQYLRYLEQSMMAAFAELQYSYIQKMLKLRCELENENMADISRAIWLERQRCQRGKKELEAEGERHAEELQEVIQRKISNIALLEVQAARKCREIATWKQKLITLLDAFQRYINYVLGAPPAQAQFLLELEKLMSEPLTEKVSCHKLLEEAVEADVPIELVEEITESQPEKSASFPGSESLRSIFASQLSESLSDVIAFADRHKRTQEAMREILEAAIIEATKSSSDVMKDFLGDMIKNMVSPKEVATHTIEGILRQIVGNTAKEIVERILYGEPKVYMGVDQEMQTGEPEDVVEEEEVKEEEEQEEGDETDINEVCNRGVIGAGSTLEPARDKELTDRFAVLMSIFKQHTNLADLILQHGVV